MKKTFNFGKIDYHNRGRKDCPVTVEVELREREQGPELSICGTIWNRTKTNCYTAGQCLDTIAEYVHDPIFKELYGFWELYHLNGMHPECEHQAALGWTETARKKVEIKHYSLTTEAFTAKMKAERRILDAARKGEDCTPTEEERKALSLEYSITGEPPEDIAHLYKLKDTETKALGWLREDEHPDGILGKACPVCGYRYGSGWKYHPIPENDLARIKELIGG